ncbi:MAG TPA: hypothetical protein VK963_01075 [Candidatus Saccharimonadales bacterium]|nr:hypothetical protein [Candidatus Saccharimonadales bacterium]
MSKVQQINSIQVGEDLAHQGLFWKIERAGWAVLLLVLMGALLGYSGAGGPLNQAVAQTEGLELEYDRFMRQLAPSQLKVKLAPASAETVSFSLSQDYLDQLQIQNITPQPDSITATGDKLQYQFAATPGSSLTVTFDIQPSAVGLLSGDISRNDENASFKQVVYP